MSATTIIVDLTDESGEEIGRSVPVNVEYVNVVEGDYGADADGNRGTILLERIIVDLSIEVPDLMVMNSGQVERVLADAREIFAQRSRLGRF